MKGEKKLDPGKISNRRVIHNNLLHTSITLYRMGND